MTTHYVLVVIETTHRRIEKSVSGFTEESAGYFLNELLEAYKSSRTFIHDEETVICTFDFSQPCLSVSAFIMEEPLK